MSANEYSTMDYQTIKSLAKEQGVSTKDLLALAPQNDPFYVGTKTTQAMAEWFADIWGQAGYGSGVHLRRVHYWLVSQETPTMHNGKPYENTDNCWKYLGNASKYARYLGLVRISDVADNKNPEPHTHVFYNHWKSAEYSVYPPRLNSPYSEVDGIDNSKAQPYHLEIWIEKSTMNDELLPIARKYGANLVTFEGEVSVTACYDLVQRAKVAHKPARVFYISDFDPAGNSMPVAMSRKVEYMLSHYSLSLDIKVCALALTLDQVQQFNLPRKPIKETEKRAARFEESFGAGAVELDALEALHAGELESIVSAALEDFYSHEAAREVSEKRHDLHSLVRNRIDAITAKYTDEIAALEEMKNELGAIDIDTEPFNVDTYAPTETENGTWLFDSERDYLDQIDYYKAHKSGEL